MRSLLVLIFQHLYPGTVSEFEAVFPAVGNYAQRIFAKQVGLLPLETFFKKS